MAKTFAIGDIHGALKALDQLLERMHMQEDDQLIFLGDYVDGWSQSAQVIDRLIALDNTYNCIFIKGNHDIWCEDWLYGAPADEEWLFHGGKMTVESYKDYTKEQKLQHLGFFNKFKDYYVDGSNRLFIHAGFASMHGPTKERYESNFLWDRTLWEMALATDPNLPKNSKRYPKRLRLFHEIFIGHTPTLNYEVREPMQACNVWNIDTGAAFTGMLSALDIESKDIFQSDAVRSLYPGEMGRNKL